MSSRPDTTAEASQPVEGSLIGRRVNKYEIVRTIGRGGMGTVYEAINTAIGKRVAMKFVDADLTQHKDAIARFHREAQAASAVESAHIVEIFDSGFTDDDVPYLVMELLRGEDLGHRIKRCGRLELTEALHVTVQILRGLHRAHEAGIVHRDLKPDNIFLVDRDDDPNFAKILDFGISKVQRGGGVPAHTLTREGTVLGTPFYMSPEQAQALPDVDGRTDLWAVGAILYECLTGHPPHSGNTYEQVIVNICMKDAHDVRMDNPAVPEPVARVISKALARERSERFSSAREFLDALVAGSGGLISHRSARASGDELSPGATSAPGLSRRTPAHAAQDASGFDPTLEVNGVGSKVGWSTSGRGQGQRRQKRTLAAICALSLASGLAGARLFQRSAPAPLPPLPAEAEDSEEIAIELRTNAEGARFTVEGVDLAERTLTGRTGETKRVRVEAAGYTPIDKEVTLQRGSGPIDVKLTPLPPVVAPAAATTQAADATAAAAQLSASVRVPSTRPKGPTSGVRPVATKQTPTPSQPTGVAGGLQLKVD
jgi:eukaryotic-like serine/threonine-protein kinase